MRSIQSMFFSFCLMSSASYADLDIKHYKNCTGSPLEELNGHSKLVLPVIDSYQNHQYHYSAVLDRFETEMTQCFVVDNNRKVILDTIPSLISNSCSGQWDKKSKTPLWMADIGGGKDGVEYFPYLPSEQLKQVHKSEVSGIRQIIKSIDCQLSTYQKQDAAELNDAAFFLYQMGYYDDSLRLLKHVITLDPNRTVAYLNRADVYFALKNLGQARKNYMIYADQMKKSGLSNKVPLRIKQFL
ncbi:tetratricopeptide repeat protein [Acinetobacter colistiniresistens]|uniref:tetratricopeptide repeat protein n=1 Tax=Acinetobacter colistiniresistens TaxID=280145 RepID=UPI00211CD1D5|nr:tetratricopeptide repeat protein [Acinetobacter colistiniresistens]UUM27424.1 tetratricopeptide repeat protein [Acinetobacter colistiniresistens]